MSKIFPYSLLAVFVEFDVILFIFSLNESDASVLSDNTRWRFDSFLIAII